MRRFDNEVHEFIKNNVSGKTTRELAKMVEDKFKIPFSEKQMKSYKTNHHLKSNTPKGFPKGYSFIFSKEVQDFIASNYKGIGNQELCDKINSKFNTSYTRTQIKEYKYSRKLSSGLTGYFEKGHIPPNKGKKMSPEQYKKCAPTMFKKGNVPHNQLPVGAERIESKDGYTLVKIKEPNVWKLKHVYLWEKHFGEVPKGYQVTFIDQNKENIAIENLALISNQENIYINRNHLFSNNKDLNYAAIKTAQIVSAIKKKEVKKQK